ncbi:MAG: ethylbenzene dehydrogenase-related protein [candidate division Zixibacteria bacterium]|nr:ethylbenzene dehydrogenase-related protein [candidate division Zixibacteria bacterium]
MSRKWLVLAGFALFFIVVVVFSSCSKDKGVIDTSSKDTLYVKSVSTSPDTADIINDPLWDEAEEFSIRIGEDKNYTNDLKVGIVKTKAVADTAYVYMRFDWRDSTMSVRPGYWTNQAGQECAVWTQNADTTVTSCPQIGNALNPRWENEDVLGLLIDIGNNGVEKANCFTTCHTGADTSDIGYYHYTTGDGNIDAWVWRAGRSNPLGLADDQCWGPKNQTRREDSYTVESCLRNSIQPTYSSDPKWMHRTGHTYAGSFLFTADTVMMDISSNWQPRDGVPGYVLNTNWNTGNTSRYDIKAKVAYDDQLKRWTVVMWRRLTTPYTAEDVNFKDGRKEFQATLAIMDHAFERHSGSKPFTIKFE